jgi:hypothetical protein
MSDQPQTTLRDALTSAIEAHEDNDNAEVITSEVASTESADKVRDDKGRFATKPEDVQSEVVQEVVAKPRPTSWKKDYEEKWSQLDPSLQEYIHQRESDYAKGVSTYKQNYESVQPIYEAMQPFVPLLQQHNIQPQQWITNLGNAHKVLAMGAPEEKLQAFARLAADYGVPLQALTGQQYDPQQSMVLSEVNTLKQQLAQFQQMNEQREQLTLQQEIDKFRAEAPHFEEVKETMGMLLQSGVATDLKSAYDKAIRLNDEVWQKQQAEASQAQAQADVQKQVQKAAESKAKAVSTRSNSPTAVMTSGNSKDRRAILAEAVESHLGAGRV